jgi:hypothetical protein
VVDQGKGFESVYFDTLLAFFHITKKSRPAAHPRHGSVVERLFGTINSRFIHNLRGNTQLTKNVRQLTKDVNPKNLAVWNLEDLTAALSTFCTEVYDCTRHPALGESPREAMVRAMAATGQRQHLFIPYDSVFRILTLPTTKYGFAKVHCQKGVHINYLDYWSDAFLDPSVEGAKVPVRFDPWDASVAYAFVKSKWVTCVSSHANVFTNWSQRAIETATKELRARNTQNGKLRSITARQLADFMTEVSSSEEFLVLRARQDAERRAVREELGAKQPTAVESTPIDDDVLDTPADIAAGNGVVDDDSRIFNISED